MSNGFVIPRSVKNPCNEFPVNTKGESPSQISSEIGAGNERIFIVSVADVVHPMISVAV